MKDILQTLWSLMKGTNGPTRVVLCSAFALALAMAGYSAFRASNPSFVLLYGDLDESQLSAVQSAIAKGGIRFRTSSPPGPYTIWVDSEQQYEALSQVATESALQADPRGISSGAGMDSVWMSSGEREQMMLKRRWQEVELQLESYPWIGKARVTGSAPEHKVLSREPERDITVSVVLQLVGTTELDPERSDTVAQIVCFGFGIPRENVIISDQNGVRLFDGSSSRGMDELLAHQREFDHVNTERVQQALDMAYGSGLTVASVHGEWSYDELESVEEKIDPTSKSPISEFSHDTQTPQGLVSGAGGAVGLDSNTELPTSSPSSGEESLATTSEVSKEYAVSRNTSHLRQTAPVLERLAVSVVLDKSLDVDLAQIEKAVKGIAGFDEARDTFTSMVATFPSVARDDQGKPVPVQVEPASRPVSPIIGVIIERAVEIVAALAFVFVLLRSLKRSQRVIALPEEKKQSLSDFIPEEKIDLDVLARAHVDELLRTNPEKVSKLLSRWASGESFYTRSTP
jgi:flagellar biosynthesis/type III secretory pathway M-ring protein FliF/YscJ